jgi:glycosyltransferase involved in cell wall biosynthesis
VICIFSNFRPVKRILDAVEIFALVREKMPAKLVMIGDGPDRGPAEELAVARNVQNDVLFLGKQNAVQAKLSQADLFLLPSQLESFGLAALEAMACEVPVIVKLAAKYAIDLLSRADRGREVGLLARAHAKKNFCANDVIPMYERYYERVLAQRSTARA